MPTEQVHLSELLPIPPYNFAHALEYLRGSPGMVLEDLSEEGVYRRALEIDGHAVLLTLRSLGTVDEPRLLLEVAGAAVPSAVAERARALVTRAFSLAEDPAPFLAVARADPVFASLVERRAGLRPVLFLDPFEALIWAILGQQIHVGFARTLKRAMVHLCGREVHVCGQAYPLLPRPEDVAALAPEALRARQFSRQKTAYCLAAGQAVASGALDLEALRTLPPADALETLTRLPGIGRWTAEYVLMRGLGAHDSIPAADMGLRIVLGDWYHLGRKASEAEVRALAERWAGWRGWAAFYWWLARQQRLTP